MRGATPSADVYNIWRFNISIHAPMRGATQKHKTIPKVYIISIHAPMRGATAILVTDCLYPAFQSTPPCGERLKAQLNLKSVTRISIHAPMRGATLCVPRYSVVSSTISIHAPMRGATGLREKEGIRINDFNPRPHAGSDYSGKSYFFRNNISIHAPMRGATGIICAIVFPTKISIHAPMRGATDKPGGDDLMCNDFNPRPHAGSDTM